ncbi:conserved protein of unknown function [Rhodovastum atsumiense]|uniref:Uncharacterized protein n=1 Tax=Rhodovastum atsumiense TaxID=504468 RepID=A0A5M6IXN5_9PROT|nr:DUF6111 family protein [Rhodovastum atsumiense]KAA5613052.1 hypothetical protein F1189_06755 [Rhodovastum atsumiense]CAH2600087.1 conserved protein of unknown function [Rhodovastum atsumiense]
MLRLAEIGLFLVPFALYAAWRLLGARASAALVWGTVLAVGLLAGVTVWYGLERSLPAGVQYVPAEIHDGTIVQGHGR